MLLRLMPQLEKSLYEKDADQPVEAAFITKLPTAYLVYEAIHQGKLLYKLQWIFLTILID